MSNKDNNKQMLKMFVLAGGFGSRLRSAVSDVPKPLAPVNGIPFLQLQIDNWVRQGIRSFVFLLHHKAEMIIDFLNSQKSESLRNCSVEWIIEKAPMGTGGSLYNAINQIGQTDDFLVSNADTWLGDGVIEVIQAEGLAIAITHVENIQRYGSVNVINGHIVGFSEKGQKEGDGWINAGLYKLSPDIFLDEEISPGSVFSLEEILFPKLASIQKLKAVSLSSSFIDIGIPDDYYKFCRWINNNKQL